MIKMSIYSDTIVCIFINILITYPIIAVLPEPSKSNPHLPEADFGDHEYAELPVDSIESKDQILEPEPHYGKLLPIRGSAFNKDDPLDPNIKWDSEWASDIKFGQVSAVSIDPAGNVVVFHRGTRVWGSGTFDEKTNTFDKRAGPIEQNTVVILNKTGDQIISQWGHNMFYLPHGLTVDAAGNYWITDVAMHQVFKFNAKDIEMYKEQVKNNKINFRNNVYNIDSDDLFKNSILKPSIILGEAFVPGNDNNHFCKPTAVAVHSNGDFFVSDGYCNSRIIKYNSQGEKILQWGRQWDRLGMQLVPNAFAVPHALALSEDHNYILVADREHGRVLCFYSNNGEFHKEYKDPRIGTKVFSIAYARNKIYLVNGPDFVADFKVRGFVIDVETGDVVSQFGPNGDMQQPHDIAVSEDGSVIYVAELNLKKALKFVQGSNVTRTATVISSNSASMNPISARLSESSSSEITLMLSILIASIILITLCLIMTVVVARCRKRGCLLTPRKRMDWDTDRNENFKLSSLLGNRVNRKFRFFEKRPNTRDFNKLGTEPETSDDESCENHLTNII